MNTDKDIERALHKMQEICSSKETCSQEVLVKLLKMNLIHDEAYKIIETLKLEKYIDDQRFANYFVRDKLRFNKWGKNKIKFELQKKITDKQLIVNALENVNIEESNEILEKELLKKWKSIEKKEEEPYKKLQKLIRLGLSKGFEYQEVMNLSKKIMKNEKISEI